MSRTLYLIDTSSLLSLVRYYLCFDDKKILYYFIEEQLESGNFILLKSVFSECGKVNDSLIVKKLEFLKNIKKHPGKIAIDKTHHNKLDNNWCVSKQKNTLTDEEFRRRKKEFIESADCQLILHAININKKEKTVKPVIVTEESKSANDGKLFKKFHPFVKEKIDCFPLPKLLVELNIKINFDIQN